MPGASIGSPYLVTRPRIVDNAINADKIEDDAVETAKIQDSAVETTKIKDLAVNITKITFTPGAATFVVSLDPETGDYTDIQTAIDALPADGGNVFIKEGDYLVTTPIIMDKNNISLIGSGKNCKIYTDSNIRIIQVYNAASTLSGINISNLHIYGANQRLAAWSSQYGIYLENVENSRIDSCWIDRNFYGIYMDTCTDVTLVNNKVFINFKGGIYTSGCDYNTISYNDVYENTTNPALHPGITITGMGMDINLSDQNIIMGNNVYSNEYSGLSITNCNNNMLIGNNCYNNYENGITINPSSNYNTITANVCTLNGYDGIGIGGTNYYNIISSNNCCLNGRSGCELSGGACYNTIIGNIFSDNSNVALATWQQRGGFSLYNSCNNNIIKGNIISGNPWGLLFRDAGNLWNIFEGNNIFSNDSCGVLYLSSGHNNNSFTNNIFKDNGTSGGMYIDGSNNHIVGNKLYSNTNTSSPEIWLPSNANYNEIANNYIDGTGGGKWGIYDLGNYNFITGNYIINTTTYIAASGANTRVFNNYEGG